MISSKDVDSKYSVYWKWSELLNFFLKARLYWIVRVSNIYTSECDVLIIINLSSETKVSNEAEYYLCSFDGIAVHRLRNRDWGRTSRQMGPTMGSWMGPWMGSWMGWKMGTRMGSWMASRMASTLGQEMVVRISSLKIMNNYSLNSVLSVGLFLNWLWYL